MFYLTGKINAMEIAVEERARRPFAGSGKKPNFRSIH
jgi:hypothetical protein